MEIGVVVHGPGIIDSGWAKRIIDILSDYGNVRCRLGGTMGRTAVIDAALEDIIDISLKLLPSQSLELFNREGVDVIFLLNYGKSPETGRVFGYKVFNHYFKQISNEDYLATNHKPLYESSIPVIQIERPGEEDGSIISWNTELNDQLSKSRKSKILKLGLGKKNMVESLSFNFEDLFNHLKSELNLVEVTPEDVVESYLSNVHEDKEGTSIEKLLESYEDYQTSNYTYRKIHGVGPDENIFVNGTVIGYSNADSIVLVARDGFIVDIINGTLKQHGVDKLGPVDLERVIVKTGLLRKSDDVNPRVVSHRDISVKDTERKLYSGEISDDEFSFKIAYVDHAAYDIYKFKDFDLVVTIGDDTSLVASDILYRFDIPIIGVTDGDLDKVVESGFVNERSVIIEVSSGFDDIVGHHIHDKLFMSNDTLEIPYDGEAGSVEEFKSVMLNVFKSYMIENIKEVVPSFVEKDSEYNVVNSYEGFVGDDAVFADNLDVFIDEFEYEDGVYMDGSLADEVYVDDSLVDEVYVEHEDLSTMDEVYVDHEDLSTMDEVYVDHEDLSTMDEVYVEHEDVPPVEEIYVEHPEDSVEEVYVDHDDVAPVDEIYVEHDIPIEEVYVEDGLDEDSFYEEAPIEEVYLDDSIDDVVFVESDEDISSIGVEDVVSNELENFEEELIKSKGEILDSEKDSEAFEEECDGSGEELTESEEEFVHSKEESDEFKEDMAGSRETLPAFEEELGEYEKELDKYQEELDESEEELDDSDGWGEYIEEEFGDSSKESDDSS